MKIRIYLTMLLSIAVLAVSAQNGYLTGRISDSNMESLPGATILVKNTNIGTISGNDGSYRLSGVPTGQQEIEVRYIGYQTLVQKVEVSSGEVVVLDFKMEIGVELEGVIVNSRLEGESKALNTQKNAESITAVVSSEQLERFPDANIGDALKRISGINVQYDQGEARFGNVRGTSPELNSVTINGERIPSAEAEIRSVQLDLLPSDMIETIEFNKAVTADMDADAIGGSINLKTKSAPYKMTIKGKLGAGWNFVAEKPSYKGSVTIGNRFFNNKLGIVASASVHDNQLGSDNIEAEWDYADENDKDGSAFLTDFQNRQYYLIRMRQSYSAAVDYKINKNHTLYGSMVYTHRNDWENRYRLRYKDIELNDDGQYEAEIRRQTKFGVEDNKYSRIEDQRMMNYMLSGEHAFGSLKVDWSGSYAKASEERPQERYISYRAKGVLVDMDLTDMTNPIITPQDAVYGNFSEEYSLKELTEEYQYTDEIDKNGRINFELPLSHGDYASKIKFGARYRGKEKKRANEFYEYEPIDDDAEAKLDELVFANLEDQSKDNFMAGDYQLGNFVSRELSDVINLEDESMFEKTEVMEEYAGNFEAKEDIMAGYLMLNQKLGSKFTILAGVRFEQTNIEYQGWEYYQEIEEDDVVIQKEDLVQTELVKESYQNILPNVHVKYALNNKTNIRLAWTNTLARPHYFDLVPYQEINEDNEISLGNPELKPTESMNFDLFGEHYFSNVGALTAGVFYKDMTNVIAYQFHSDYEYNGRVYDEFRQPSNIANASLLGAEIGISRKLDFLPSFLSKLTFYGNYTYVHSSLEDVQIEGREDEVIPLGGSPESTVNLSLAYDSKKFDLRVSYNYASAFLNNNDDGGMGEEAFFDFYYDAVNYLDVNAEYRFHKNWEVYANAKNLLNQPLRTYWGQADRLAQAEYYGMRLNAGIKFNF
jgi:TonB-dependent receptor